MSEAEDIKILSEEEHKELFMAWLKDPAKYKYALLDHQKAVELATDASGGFAQPEELRNEAVSLANEINIARILCGVTASMTGAYRAAVTDEFSASWVGETDVRGVTATGTFSSQNPTFGEVYAKGVVTEWALDDMVDSANWLVRATESTFAVTETKAFISGTGANQPSGMLLNAPTTQPDNARARDTYQETAIGAAGSITAQSLAALQASLPDEYLGQPQNCAWLMHPDVYAEVRELDSSLRAPTRDGAISTFFDMNCFVSKQMPAPGVASNSVAVGNFSDGYQFLERFPGTRYTRDSVSTIGKINFYARRRIGGGVLNNRAIRFGVLS